MPPNRPAYTVKPYPLSRRVIVDSARFGKRRNTINGLVEVDVTDARSILGQHRERTGESLSFTAFILACLGRADRHPRVPQPDRQLRPRHRGRCARRPLHGPPEGVDRVGGWAGRGADS